MTSTEQISSVASTDAQLSAALRWLLESWCDRRCFAALRILLQVFPPAEAFAPAHTPAGSNELLLALKDVRAFAREELTEPEMQLIHDCIHEIDKALHPR